MSQGNYCQCDASLWIMDKFDLTCHPFFPQVTRTPLKLWLKECNSRDTEQKWFWSNFDDEGLFLGEDENPEAEADSSTHRTDL